MYKFWMEISNIPISTETFRTFCKQTDEKF